MKKLVLIAALLAVVVSGCSTGNLVRSRVEKGIAGALPEYIGPAREYKVNARGSSTAMIKGRIEQLHIEGSDVQIDPNLQIARMIVDMDDIRYKTSSREVTSVAATRFQATVSEAAVNNYIEKTRQDASDLSVSLEKDKVGVQFVPNVAGIEVLVSVTGKPALAGSDKVNFIVDSGSVAHLPVPSYVVNRVLDRINPILDMSLMKFPVVLDKITVKKDAVVIEGRAEFKTGEQ